MTGAGERVASSSRWTASGCIDLSSTTRVLRHCGQQLLGARIVRDHRLVRRHPRRRGRARRSHRCGPCPRCSARARAGRATIPAHDLDHAIGGIIHEPAVHLARVMSSAKNERPSRGTAAPAVSRASRPSTRLGACSTSSSARRSMMRRMPRPRARRRPRPRAARGCPSGTAPPSGCAQRPAGRPPTSRKLTAPGNDGSAGAITMPRPTRRPGPRDQVITRRHAVAAGDRDAVERVDRDEDPAQTRRTPSR